MQHGIAPEDIYNFDETGYAMGLLIATAQVVTRADMPSKRQVIYSQGTGNGLLLLSVLTLWDGPYHHASYRAGTRGKKSYLLHLQNQRL